MKTKNMMLVGLWVLLSLGSGQAEEAEAPQWSGNLGLAYVATSGNSDTQTFGIDFKMERAPDPWGLTVAATFDRADQDGELTAERYRAGIRGLREFNDRWSVFTGVSAEQDEFAGYKLLALLEAGATYTALLGPVHTLALDFGVTYTDEDRLEPDPDSSYVGAVLGLDYAWAISERSKLTQTIGYYPNFDESSDWRAVSETGIEASINDRLALKMSYGIRYRNMPLSGRDDTDTTTKASLVFKL